MLGSAVKIGMRVHYVGDADNHGESHLVPERHTVGTVMQACPNTMGGYSAQVKWDSAPPKASYNNTWWYRDDVLAPVKESEF